MTNHQEAQPSNEVETAAALKIMRKSYGRLHDMLSDMVEGGRLSEAEIPDDYQALVDALAECDGADHATKKALQNATPKIKPLKKYSVIITRDITESTFVEVSATDPEQAENKALEKLSDTTDARWEVDDGSWDNSQAYVTDVDEETES